MPFFLAYYSCAHALSVNLGVVNIILLVEVSASEFFFFLIRPNSNLYVNF